MNAAPTRNTHALLTAGLLVLLSALCRAEQPTAPTELAPSPPVSADWLATVEQDIATSEYQVTWQEETALQDVPEAYQAPNRAHNLRTYFTDKGPRIIPRIDPASPLAHAPKQDRGPVMPGPDQDATAASQTEPGISVGGTETPSWELGLEFAGFGTDDATSVPPAIVEMTTTDDRIEYQRGNITEWYVNGTPGLEQGFTIAEPPAADADVLVLDVAVTGDLNPNLSGDGKSIEFLNAEGVGLARYEGLSAFDAMRRPLPAHIELDSTEKHKSLIRISIEVVDAVYPVTVDPLLTTTVWTAEGNQFEAYFGLNAGIAGDVNGDGYDDVIVGAHYYDHGEDSEGRAFVYYGSAAGPSPAADWIYESNVALTYFGTDVASAGDVNGDGYDDIVVGAVSPYTFEGQAFVFLGGQTGLQAAPAWVENGDAATSAFGTSVACAGDINGDGFDDVVIGAPKYDGAQSDEGQVFVYHGSGSGLVTTPAWQIGSGQPGFALGSAVSAAGDVNGDGYEDVIAGAQNASYGQTAEGAAFVYAGSASGISGIVWTGQSDQAYSTYGVAVATAGDVNGDGYSDVIVGARDYDHDQTNEGRVYLYLGSNSGLGTSIAWSAEGDQDNATMGFCVSSAGDVNNDGYDDVIFSLHAYDTAQTNAGRAHLFLGSPSGLAGTPDWVLEGSQAQAYFGVSVTSGGDVNGDGFDDLVIGSHAYDNGEAEEGRVYVYYGSAAGPGFRCDWMGEGNQASALYGTAVADAGDVNGDGYGDVLVGAVWYDNGQTDEGRAFLYQGSAAGLGTSASWTAECNQAAAEFGAALSTAGDINHDGYDDVIVGAHGYDNPQVDEGQVYVYHGSASGLSPAANWTADANGTGGWLGHSVASAGDINGDGYDDIIVGAYAYTDGLTEQGRVFGWYGSSSGLGPNGTYANADWAVNGPHASAYFGVSISGAGDVNNDGYDDVIVGAHSYTNGQTSEGGAFVYLGSSAGLNGTANWSAQSDQAFAYLGTSVSGAGDVNGDGRDDVVVGSFRYTNDQSQEGRAIVYYGAGASLSATPGWYAEGNQISADFGNHVAAAGDLNADGFDDIIVGAYLADNGETDEGRVFVFQGSAAGLSTVPFWSAEGNQTSAYFGSSVSRAGDVNGDGYDDIIVGAPNFDKGQGDEGAAFVYYGPLPGLDAGSAEWTNESGQGGARFGLSVFTAGDVNADGYDDVIVGAPYYDNGQADEGLATVYHGTASGLLTTAAWSVEGEQASAQLGRSVATAGDLNGDGYDDVILAAPYYDNPETDEGRAFTYLGSSTGLGTTPSWTAEGEMPAGNMGMAVASAGDVNHDGYDDIIIGGAFYDPDGGDPANHIWCAAVYHGSSTGLPGARNWLGYDAVTNSYYGFSVAGAGDVNGDSYDDVVVGAFNCNGGQSSEGRTYVYHGSTSGLSATVNWSNESNQVGAYYGYSVAGGGDVNGDGYADIIVGAPYWDYYYANEGLAFVYPGSASGLTGYSWFMGSYQPGAYFGYSVAMIGDVNSDGFDDFAAGASFYDYTLADEGQAYVYSGSATGVSSAPHWTARGGQATAYFGLCLAPAGDVNGDGAADLLVAAPYYDNGETDEGRAFVYYGNPADQQATVTRLSASGNALSTNFGDAVRVQIDFASGAGASTERATLNRFAPGNLPDGATALLPVGWQLESNRAAYAADVTFRYTNQELGDADEAGLVVFWSATGAAGTWRLAGASQTLDAAHNEITVHGLTNVNGFYAIGEHLNLAPVVSLAASPNPAAPGQEITFTTSVWDPDAGDTASVELDFGDGTTGNGVSATHAYTLFGSYTVTVTVSDSAEPVHVVIDEIQIDVNQGNLAPVSVPGGPYTIEAGQTLVLDGSGSYDPNAAAGDSIVSYAWDINNDGNYGDATGRIVSFTWAQLQALGISAPYAGSARLRVTDTFGMTGTGTASLTVSAAVPPTVTLSSTAPDPTNLNPIPVTATFSEPVTGFAVTDITVSGGTAGNFGGGDTVFTFDLTASGDGVVTAEIPAGVCTDLAGNANLGSGYRFERKWGTGGSGDGQFIMPHGVGVDSAGNVYVADQGNNRIQKFDSNGAFLGRWGSYGTIDGRFDRPTAVAADSLGNVFVVDYGNHRIQKFTTAGSFLAKWGGQGNGDGLFYYPMGIGVDISGNVYVVDSSNNRIQKFTNTGGFVTKWGGSGTGDGMTSGPMGVAVDQSGQVFVSEWGNQRIQVFTSSGGFLRKWGASGSGNGQFNLPTGVGVDSSGNVLVIEYSNRRIQKFTPLGGFITKWGSSGSGDGQFSDPFGLAVDASSNVYVGDRSNNRVQKFAYLDTVIRRTYDGTPPTAPAVSGDASPTTITTPTWTWTPGGGGNGTYRHNLDSTVWTETTDLTFTPASGLSDGTHRLVVQERDEAGNWSVDSFFDIVVDTTPPDPPVVTGTTPTNNTTPTWTWTAGGGGNGTFRYDLDTSGSTETTDVSFTPASPLAEGTHRLVVQERDEAGNWSVDSFFDIVVDTTPPDPPVVTGTTPTNNTTPTWTWTAGGGGNGTFRYDLDASGVWTETTDLAFTPATPLAEGTHRLVVQERDDAGNWNADGFFDIEVDLTPPSPPVVGGTTPTNNTTPTWTWTSGGGGNGTFRYDLDASGVWTETTELAFTPTTPLAEGTHQLVVQERDDADNWSDAGFFDIEDDLTPPTFEFNSIAPDPTNLNPIPVTVTFSEAVMGFEAADISTANGTAGAVSGADADYAFDLSPQADGLVSAGLLPGAVTDLAGNFAAGSGYAFAFLWGDPSEMQTPFGITVDSDENVYITDNGNNRIQKFAPDGTLLLHWGAAGSDPGEFNYPAGMAADASDSIYVADSHNNRIQKFSANGLYLLEWGTAGMEDGQFNTPVSVAADKMGHIYVADLWNQRIQKFSETGVFLAKWGSPGSGDGEFRNPAGVAADAAGNVYVSDVYNVRVQKFDAYGAYLLKWGIAGTGPGQFLTVFDLSVDAAGLVYVADRDNNCILKFSPAGEHLATIGGPGAGEGQLHSPMDVAVSSSGRVYVPDADNNRIQAFDPAGRLNRTYDATPPTVSLSSIAPDPTGMNPIPVTATFSEPVLGLDVTEIVLSGAVAENLDGSGAVYTFDLVPTGDGMVIAEIPGDVCTDLAGNPNIGGDHQLALVIDGAVSGSAAFGYPFGVDVDTLGNIYVTDSVTPRILKFNPEGALLAIVGEGILDVVSDIGVTPAGHIYAVEVNQHRVTEFDAAGGFERSWGSMGGDDGQFQYPWGIDVDIAGFVYVADLYGNRVQVFTVAGEYVRAITGLTGPRGVALDAEGNVYVAEHYGQAVKKFDAAGVLVGAWGSPGTGSGEFGKLNSIDVDPWNNVYVIDTENDRIQLFTGNGGFITTWGVYGSGVGQFDMPYGLACGPGGGIYVADSGNNRVQVFSASAGRLIRSYDGTPPAAPVVSGSTAPTQDSTPTWTWTPGGGGDGNFRYSLDAGDWVETTAHTLTPLSALAEGSHRLIVQERDVLMRWSTDGIFDIVVDLTPPAAPVVAGATPTNDTTPEWTWSAGGGGAGAFRYNLDSSGWTETLLTTFTPAAPLAAGSHRLVVQERDEAGNWSGDGAAEVFIDLTPPAVLSSLRAGANPSNATSVQFTVTFSEAITGLNNVDFALTTTGSLSGAAVFAVSGSGAAYTVTVNTGTGSGTLRLDVVDDDSIVDNVGNPLGGAGAGNGAFTAGQAYTIDKTAPLVTVNPLTTTDTTPSLTGTASDPGGVLAGVTVTLGGMAHTATLGSGTWTLNVTSPLFVGSYNVIARATDTAGNVATDATSNELTIQAVGSPAEVWVDFAWTGTEAGTPAEPYNTLAEGVNAAIDGGTVKLKGNTARNTSSERLTITKHVRIVAVNGTVRIGVLGGTGSPELVSADALDTAPMAEVLQGLQRLLAGEDFLGGAGLPWAAALYEPVLPFTQDANGRRQAREDSVLAVRLRHPDGIDPNSLWAPVQAQGGAPSVSWQPVEDGDLSDLWVIVRPQDHWLLEDLVSLTVNGATLEGSLLEPVTYEFQVVPDDIEAPEAPAPLAEGLDSPVAVTPDSVYAEPQQVWLPVPEGVNAEDLQLYYYHPNGECRGWYPAEQVAGWLVPGSEQLNTEDGVTYYGFQVRHAGIAQLGLAAGPTKD